MSICYILVGLIEEALILNQSHNVVPGYDENQNDKGDESHLMDKAFFVGINGLAADFFNKQKNQS